MADWKQRYYQYANRLAVLHHRTKHDVKARLLFIYFCGDGWPRPRVICPKSPKTESDWSQALKSRDRHLKLPDKHCLADRVHKLFLPVWFDA